MKEIKYKGFYLEASEENINGHIYERVKLRPGVVVFPVKENKILLIREVRILENTTRVRFISGWIDKEGKNSLEIAKEELAEEANMKAGQWELLYESRLKDATVESDIDFFIAKDVKTIPYEVENPDTGGVEEIFWVDEKQFWEMLGKKEIRWTEKTTAALLIFKRINKK